MSKQFKLNDFYKTKDIGIDVRFGRSSDENGFHVFYESVISLRLFLTNVIIVKTFLKSDNAFVNIFRLQTTLYNIYSINGKNLKPIDEQQYQQLISIYCIKPYSTQYLISL